MSVAPRLVIAYRIRNLTHDRCSARGQTILTGGDTGEILGEGGGGCEERKRGCAAHQEAGPGRHFGEVLHAGSGESPSPVLTGLSGGFCRLADADGR